MGEKVVKVKEVEDQKVQGEKVANQEVVNNKDGDSENWQTVKGVISVVNNVASVEKTTITLDSDESVLNKHKKNGHKRDGPQTASVEKTKDNITVHLEKEMENLKVSQTFCEQCHVDLVKNVDFLKHMKTEHSKQWNCDLCDFQASTRQVLMKHCKLTPGHLPSQQRLGQTGVMECYT